VITAALILASALLMRLETPGWRLFGYPWLALVSFLLGTGIGLTLIWSAFRRDHRAGRRRSAVRGERG
jgi:ABC-type nickel/cobalt efflux system permease component RcnA